jgi:hypothetical protein
MIRMVAQREAGVGGQQMQIDQAVGSSLHLSGIILKHLEVRVGLISTEVTTKTVLTGPGRI